jgi:hypothetical protein
LTEALLVDKLLYEPIRVDEERLEALLSTAAPTIFSGFEYFEFKPAIRCADGIRHPDGVLLASGSREWWVVEVETHLHHPKNHIEPQLTDLMGGLYGPDAFKYLDRHDHFDADKYTVDTYEPSFLLIIDSLIPEIRNLAVRIGLPAIECAVYFAAEANRYALSLSGPRPQAGNALKPGISLELVEEDGMALLVPTDGRKMPPLRAGEILIAEEACKYFSASDSRGIVLPLTPAEVRANLRATDRFKLITKTMRLVADPSIPETLIIDG